MDLIYANLSLGIVMVGVIVGSKKVGVNPDNIATPTAASLGDIITLGLLAVISQGFFYCMGENGRPVTGQRLFLFHLRGVGFYSL